MANAIAAIFEKVAFNLRHHARQPHPWRSLFADLLARAGWSERFTYRRSGIRFRLRRAGLSRMLWVDPDSRLDGELFLERYLRPGDTLVDVGANIGVHALLAAERVGPTGRVLAIEAHPGTFTALEDNIRLNVRQNVTAVCAAAGPESGRVRLSDRPDDDWNHVGAGGTIEIEQRPLDELGRDCPRVTLLKIDIEGYELPCLRGATALLARTDCVLLEYWEEHVRRFGYRLTDLTGLLREMGFTATVLDEKDGKVRLTPLREAEPLPGLQNLVFARGAAVRARLADDAETAKTEVRQ